MSRLRAILDRINDVEAAMARIEAEAKEHTSLAYRMSIDSLVSRRAVFQEELEDATREGFVEICDYRIIPENSASYAISAVTAALHDFQDLVTLVFDAITDKVKKRASRDPVLLEKTRFDFGFAHSGSLGIALVIQNDREFFDTNLDLAVSNVFKIIQSSSPEEIHDVALNYGSPTVRKLHSWSKTHRDYGMTADIRWIREKETPDSVVAQPQQLAEICRIIEEKNEPDTDPVSTSGILVSWDTVHRRFIIDVPDSDPIGGKISDDIDVSQERIVRVRYDFDLLKHTRVDYSSDRAVVTWELIGLKKLN